MGLFHRRLFRPTEFLEKKKFLLILMQEKFEQLCSLESRFGNMSNRACAHGNRRFIIPSISCISDNKKYASISLLKWFNYR
jgi:hypothetical protein